jgi:hypothetical protein
MVAVEASAARPATADTVLPPQPPSSSSRTPTIRELLNAQHQLELAPPVPPRRTKYSDVRSGRTSLAAEEARVGHGAAAPLWDLVGAVAQRRPSYRKLPMEILIAVFEFHGFRTLVRLSGTCRLWHRAANADILWGRVHSSLRLVNDGEDEERRLGLERLGAVEPGHDSWSTAVGVSRSRPSYKSQVQAYVEASRRRAVSAVDAAAAELRTTSERLNQRAQASGTLTAQQHDELSARIPRLQHTITAAEQSIAAQATRAAAVEKERAALEHVIRDANATLGGLQSRLRATAVTVDAQANAQRREARVAAMERRVAAVILEPVVQLPPSLRRGVDTFGCLDLLAAQLPSCDALQQRWPPIRTAFGLDTDAYQAARSRYIDRGAAPPTQPGPWHLLSKCAEARDHELAALLDRVASP